jgi:hypothetical protein
MEWKIRLSMASQYKKLYWDSAVSRLSIDGMNAEPITDAWSLRRLAISQRHCADRYIDGCLSGWVRIFRVSDYVGTTVATIQLIQSDAGWIVADVRGFANCAVSQNLCRISEVVAHKYCESDPYKSSATLNHLDQPCISS